MSSGLDGWAQQIKTVFASGCPLLPLPTFYSQKDLVGVTEAVTTGCVDVNTCGLANSRNKP